MATNGRTIGTIAAATAAALSCAGCATAPGGGGARVLETAAYEGPKTLGGANERFQADYGIPWQLTPASTASEAQGERTTIAEAPGLGRVKGTAVAIGNLDREPVPYPGPSSAVEPCRGAMAPQAARLGAYKVEARAAGPQLRAAGGLRRQQVFFRIFYKRPDLVEVRQASLSCTVDRSRRLVSAKPV